MMRTISILVLIALSACSDDSGRPVNVPMVPAGEREADCQRLCTLAAGDDNCTAKHAEFCVASCRARTNGLPAACATCLVAAGVTIHGDVDSFDEPRCVVGGPAEITACRDECDDGGAAPAADLSQHCDLACGFYMSDTEPLACSADGSADCDTACAAAITANGRICAQCLIEQTSPSRICFNDDCDCEPYFPDDSQFGCGQLCDSLLPT